MLNLLSSMLDFPGAKYDYRTYSAREVILYASRLDLRDCIRTDHLSIPLHVRSSLEHADGVRHLPPGDFVSVEDHRHGSLGVTSIVSHTGCASIS